MFISIIYYLIFLHLNSKFILTLIIFYLGFDIWAMNINDFIILLINWYND